MSRGKRQEQGMDASVTFTYESAYNQIVHPTSYVSLSQYFIAHWMPVISPAGLKILLQLRSMGYYSPKAGVQRGDIDIEQKELAALCGMSLSTLKRAFADDPVLSAYVQRVFETKRDPLTGRIVKEHYLYVVKMDDVLTPADKAKLAVMLEGPDKGVDLPKAQNEPSGNLPIAQNDLPGVQSEPPTAQNEPPRGQNDPSLNRSLHTSNTLDTSDTPGAAPEFSLALFEEKEPEPDKPPAPPPWSSLPEEGQRPYIEQARGELQAACEGVTLNPLIVEARGRNLYHLAHRR